MTVFSFHPVKAIAAGEGGMITTNDEAVYRKLLRLRSHGINKLDDALVLTSQATTDGEPNPWYYEMQELGFHYRITEMQCALALSQLKKLPLFLSSRRSLVMKYDAAFASCVNLRPAQLGDRDRSGHHLYPVLIDFKAASLSRGELMQKLKAEGIGSQVHYIPVPRHPYYVELGADYADYPYSEAYYSQALSIPLFYGLSDAQQERIIAILKALVDG